MSKGKSQDSSRKTQENRPNTPDRTNRLEDLVPELELCKEIPAGCFDDSALIWFYDGSKWWVNAREFDATPEKQYPAPTLAEIMLAIDEAGGVCPDCYYLKNTWKIDCRDKLFNYEELIEAEDEYNPADAALRLWLKVTDVRVERLQEITDDGARQEGVENREAFRELWGKINGEASWNVNPFVWVIKFERVKK